VTYVMGLTKHEQPSSKLTLAGSSRQLRAGTTTYSAHTPIAALHTATRLPTFHHPITPPPLCTTVPLPSKPN
jgi:hypothetical protein